MKKAVRIDKPALARRVEQAIKSAGLENEDVAPQVGLSSGSGVGHWRTGRSEPSPSQLERLSEATGCSLYWLVTGRDEPMALEGLLEKFRVEVTEGGDPAAVWERLTGRAMEPGERALLNAHADELRDLLRGPGGADWVRLNPEEREAVDRLVELMARKNRSPTGGSDE